MRVNNQKHYIRLGSYWTYSALFFVEGNTLMVMNFPAANNSMQNVGSFLTGVSYSTTKSEKANKISKY
jgi:hypothetical protein